MFNEILITVPKKAMQKQIERLESYIRTANIVTRQSTLMEISQAEVRIVRARELFTTLWEMKILANWMEVEADINRIESKLFDIRAERNRKVPGRRQL